MPEAMKRNPILMGEAEVISLISPAVEHMLANEGLYIGSDPDDASKGEAPVVSMQGKIWSLTLDNVLDPTRFIEGHRMDGPFRAGDVPGRWLSMKIAPKDGSNILIHHPDLVDEDYNPQGVAIASYDDDSEEWLFPVWDNVQDCFFVKTGPAACWMPILPPPRSIPE